MIIIIFLKKSVPSKIAMFQILGDRFLEGFYFKKNLKESLSQAGHGWICKTF